jgi:hypothetical protein
MCSLHTSSRRLEVISYPASILGAEGPRISNFQPLHCPEERFSLGRSWRSMLVKKKEKALSETLTGNNVLNQTFGKENPNKGNRSCVIQ